MHVNKISVHPNFGVRLTEKAIAALKQSGVSDLDLGKLPCKIPTDALIGISRFASCPYIEGDFERIEFFGEKLTMQTVDRLCKKYNSDRFFSVLKPKKISF